MYITDSDEFVIYIVDSNESAIYITDNNEPMNVDDTNKQPHSHWCSTEEVGSVLHISLKEVRSRYQYTDMNLAMIQMRPPLGTASESDKPTPSHKKELKRAKKKLGTNVVALIGRAEKDYTKVLTKSKVRRVLTDSFKSAIELMTEDSSTSGSEDAVKKAWDKCRGK